LISNFLDFKFSRKDPRIYQEDLFVRTYVRP
jgi:hypothetical protein